MLAVQLGKDSHSLWGSASPKSNLFTCKIKDGVRAFSFRLGSQHKTSSFKTLVSLQQTKDYSSLPNQQSPFSSSWQRCGGKRYVSYFKVKQVVLHMLSTKLFVTTHLHVFFLSHDPEWGHEYISVLFSPDVIILCGYSLLEFQRGKWKSQPAVHRGWSLPTRISRAPWRNNNDLPGTIQR